MARNWQANVYVDARWTVATPTDSPVYLVGNTRELGDWNTKRALPLRVQHVGPHLHDWSIDLRLPRGKSIEFKFIQKSEYGDILWEDGENRVFTAEAPISTTHWGRIK